MSVRNTSHLLQAFEWVVRDVHRLRDFIETSDDVHGEADEGEGASPETDEFEVLKETPIIGDGKFKLEIGKTVRSHSTLHYSCATRS